jgi:hypothetical protein
MQKHHGWPTEPNGTATPVMAALLWVRHWHNCDQTAASHWDAVHRDAFPLLMPTSETSYHKLL